MSAAVASTPVRTLGVDVTVTEVRDETADARTISLQFPDGASYLPGQFVTVRIPSERTGFVARSYSLSTSPGLDDGRPAITVKRIRDGYGSNWLCDNISAGDVLHVLAPAGVFTPHSWQRPLHLFAAGSGITPVMSILRTALVEHQCSVTLFYANRDPASTIFAAELDELCARYPARLTVEHWLEEERGLPSIDGVGAPCAAAAGGEAFVCGPGPFMDLIETGLRGAGVTHDDIHVERYVSLTGDPFTVAALDDAAPGTSELSVAIDGGTQVLRCGPTTTLLDAMLAHDVDAPYSCREGDCGSCVASLVSGSVDHGDGIALEEEDIADGYLLTCQAKPLSERVEIEFD